MVGKKTVSLGPSHSSPGTIRVTVGRWPLWIDGPGSEVGFGYLFEIQKTSTSVTRTVLLTSNINHSWMIHYTGPESWNVWKRLNEESCDNRSKCLLFWFSALYFTEQIPVCRLFRLRTEVEIEPTDLSGTNIIDVRWIHPTSRVPTKSDGRTHLRVSELGREVPYEPILLHKVLKKPLDPDLWTSGPWRPHFGFNSGVGKGNIQTTLNPLPTYLKRVGKDWGPSECRGGSNRFKDFQRQFYGYILDLPPSRIRSQPLLTNSYLTKCSLTPTYPSFPFANILFSGTHQYKSYRVGLPSLTDRVRKSFDWVGHREVNSLRGTWLRLLEWVQFYRYRPLPSSISRRVYSVKVKLFP